MSSLRNAVKRVTHKERSQPRARAHLGILEKKKDYRLRARDYHAKEDRIRAMRQKASMRNPDEFYFGMKNAEVRDGRHRRTQEATNNELEHIIGPDAVKVMKGQDLSYVRMQRQKDAKKIERLRASLHLLSGAGGEEGDNDKVSRQKRKHTIFVDGKEEAANFDVAGHFGTAPELAGRAFNRPRISDLGVDPKDDEYDEEEEEVYVPTQKEIARDAKAAKKRAKKVAKARSAAYSEMEARADRMAKMKLAEEHLNTEKLVAAKGRKRKIKDAEDGKPAVYKWRRKRAK
eukprot:CAMPEP_0183296050 /NCGR_PEP_ID=MMETSP0160_2-20130417/3770_1 /TAXON_ID=2839 ORGANISM="Odontella Sinensis, Strain Grunow 1884" /NCGR_SAMPLE_ID=MMETSP0160_2 /ASSEMBLY_ACC=CAM_ASM_000250 /LENGTH=287 /DNA_ID=CAMNT_0025457621 /DNA_START=171 /DNA_END=1034 /DNA_ORIENTATION=+